ncbi:unnamed protein product [Nippostrongylus brasiliensis]|uniref:Lysosomal acid phosphatase n=1 Tax=Nippostrongylus brasiliensis TaxID=27835 RepID=A0A0N4XX98_NIPBR|nr:unnamed protein product [Nippostrongylus brasiliensis]
MVIVSRALLLLGALHSATSDLRLVVGIWMAGETPLTRLLFRNKTDDFTMAPLKTNNGLLRLTNDGVKEMYELGLWLKERYVTNSPFASESIQRDELLDPPPFNCKEYIRAIAIENAELIRRSNSATQAWYRKIAEYLGNKEFTGQNITNGINVRQNNQRLLLALKYAMGIEITDVAPPGSVLIVEVHDRKDAEHTVEIYSRTRGDRVTQHKIMDCSHRCPLSRFLSNVKSMSVTQEKLHLVGVNYC